MTCRDRGASIFRNPQRHGRMPLITRTYGPNVTADRSRPAYSESSRTLPKLRRHLDQPEGNTPQKKIEIVQLWRCASCKRVFTPAPAALRNKTYPLRIVLDAITLYDLGHSLTETAGKLKTRFGRTIARATIAAWLDANRSLMTYQRLRASGRQLFPPTQTIRAIKLYHRQVYKFQYHRSKLDLLRQGREHRRFARVADFLELIPLQCPHELFRDSERASQITAASLSAPRVIVNRKENAATAMAALVIPTIGNNRLRHEALQRFMLANDSTTLAVEVPIWSCRELNIVRAALGSALLAVPSTAPRAKTDL